MNDNNNPPPLSASSLLKLYEQMLRIRSFENAAIEAAKTGLIHGPVHPCIGQEAIPVGVCENLRRDDYILSTHRGHGHSIAKGADPAAMMLELFGRKDGSCSGKGGSLHVADFSVGMLGANGVVSANIPIAVGAAHAIKLVGEDRISVTFFGDGAINRGPFLEGLNWAQVFKLPVLFVCEDNLYSATTKTDTMTAGGGAAARARSVDMPAIEVDGNDVEAVYALAQSEIAKVRNGGPRMIVAHTYRVTGHTSADPGVYRPAGEAEAAVRENDPIKRCEAALADRGATQEDISTVQERIKALMEEAVQRGQDAAWPDPSLAYTDVQTVGAPEMENNA